MRNLVYILAAFSIIFFSCEKNKEKTTIIEGVVLNAGTKQPIDSVKVLLKDGNANTSGGFGIDGNTTSGKSATVYTDKEGKFTIQITGEFTPFLLASKKDYSFWSINPHRNLFGDYLPMIFGEKQKYEINFYPNAKFQGILMQKDISRIYSKIEFKQLCKSDSVFSFCGWPADEFVGIGPHQINPYGGPIVKGDRYFFFQIEKYSSSGVETIIDSVYIPGFTTYRDTIYY